LTVGENFGKFTLTITKGSEMEKNVQNLVEATERLLKQFEYLVEMCDPDGEIGTHVDWSIDAQNAINAVKGSE